MSRFSVIFVLFIGAAFGLGAAAMATFLGELLVGLVAAFSGLGLGVGALVVATKTGR